MIRRYTVKGCCDCPFAHETNHDDRCALAQLVSRGMNSHGIGEEIYLPYNAKPGWRHEYCPLKKSDAVIGLEDPS